MDKYYVSGCIEIEENCSQVEDDKADFFTLYERDEDGLSEAIFNLGTRKDAEEMMAVYVERDALQEQVQKLAAENSALKISRSILAENALETCNEVYSAGYRNTALHDGLMNSTGNRDKYPQPIKALVSEAINPFETPETDAVIREIAAKAVEGFAEYIGENRTVNNIYCEMRADLYAHELRAGDVS